MRVADYRGPEDLRAMQGLTQRVWSPTARWHIGDLAWERRLHPAPFEGWPTQLWHDEATGDVVAWAWMTSEDHVELVVDPEHLTLVGEAIDWAIDRAGASLTVTATASDDALIEVLGAQGFEPQDRPGFSYLVHDLARLPPRRCPSGFSAHGLEPTEAALSGRVAVHRAAWESSTFTMEVLRTLQGTWPYRDELDVVVEVAGGDVRYAASCLAWLDEVNAVGALEPVGTDPRYRRRGLGAAACSEALHRLKEAGASCAIVYATNDPTYTAPAALYRSLGFVANTTALPFARAPR